VRQARSVANDEATLDATVHLLDTAGWEGCSVLRIAETTGKSRSPILERFGDRTGAVAAAWTQRLAPGFQQALANVVHAVGASGEPTDPQLLLLALGPFYEPNASMRAAAEVLLVSRYVEGLASVVASTLGRDLDSWLTPRPHHLDKEQAARHALVTLLALGMLVEVRTGHDVNASDLAPEIAHVARALDARVPPTQLPEERATHLLATPDFGLRDDALEALLIATLDEVGTYGYEGATVQRIARASGFTKGLIFARYASKRELFLDATDRMLLLAAQANTEFQERIAATTSVGVADATMTRESMRPEHRPVRTVTTEQFRLSWHDEQMQTTFKNVQDHVAEQISKESLARPVGQARGRMFIDFARGIGMGILADLHPGAWTLPIDVVLIPLIDDRGAEAST